MKPYTGNLIWISIIILVFSRGFSYACDDEKNCKENSAIQEQAIEKKDPFRCDLISQSVLIEGDMVFGPSILREKCKMKVAAVKGDINYCESPLGYVFQFECFLLVSDYNKIANPFCDKFYLNSSKEELLSCRAKTAINIDDCEKAKSNAYDYRNCLRHVSAVIGDENVCNHSSDSRIREECHNSFNAFQEKYHQQDLWRCYPDCSSLRISPKAGV
jgi:hypothetical protein